MGTTHLHKGSVQQKKFITVTAKNNWAVQGPLKGFYVNCELATHLLEKSFRIMYGNLGLSFRWTLPLNNLFIIHIKSERIAIF